MFADSDVFVLTSDFEGYPRVLMEAAASALPTVTTAISGSDESIRDGESGFIVPIGALAEIAAKIRLLIEDPELRARQGAVARAHARSQLDPSGECREPNGDLAPDRWGPRRHVGGFHSHLHRKALMNAGDRGRPGELATLFAGLPKDGALCVRKEVA